MPVKCTFRHFLPENWPFWEKLKKVQPLTFLFLPCLKYVLDEILSQMGDTGILSDAPCFFGDRLKSSECLRKTLLLTRDTR